MALKPHPEAAQAPEAEIDILGARAEPEVLMHSGHGWSSLFVGGDGAEHGVGVADVIPLRLWGEGHSITLARSSSSSCS